MLAPNSLFFFIWDIFVDYKLEIELLKIVYEV